MNQATWPIDMTERIAEMHKNTKKGKQENETEYTFTHMKRNTYIHLKTVRHTNTEYSSK